VFNKEWNAKLEAKRATEFDAEKGVRAAADQAKKDWEQQRDIRLKAKKVPIKPSHSTPHTY